MLAGKKKIPAGTDKKDEELYRMVQDMFISKEDVIKYWLTLFPEISQMELLEIVHRMDTVQVDEIVTKMNKDNNEEIDLIRYLDFEFCEYLVINWKKYSAYIPYWNFCAPFVNKELKAIEAMIKENTSIADGNCIYDTLIKIGIHKIFELACRVLVGEINELTKENSLKGTNAKERMEYYCSEILADRKYLRSMLSAYKVLPRILHTVLSNTYEFVVEVLEHTKHNMTEIKAQFGMKDTEGKITGIEIGAGDTHQSGKSVVVLTFDERIRIVYKPRNLTLDSGVYDLLDWIHEQMPANSQSFRRLNILSKENMGWTEYIENEPCHSEQEVKEFYLRIGQLLCILYTLNSVDFHYENLIACGKYPMPIDLESVFHAKVARTEKETASAYVKARKLINNSVISIGLLPTILGEDDVSCDLSGLGGNKEQEVPFKIWYVDDSNEKEIKISYKNARVSTKVNNPIYRNEFVDSREYVNEMVEGFNTYYTWILEQKEEYQSKVRALFADKVSRLIFNPTMFYDQLLKISTHPDFMHEEYERKVLFHRVALEQEEEIAWIQKAELRDLMDGDIPMFMSAIDENRILDSNGNSCVGLLEDTPMNQVLLKIEAMDETDRNRQTEFIEMSFLNRLSQQDFTHVQYNTMVRKLTPEKWLKTASEIADYIIDSGIVGESDRLGDMMWISTSIKGFEENIWKPDVLGYELYNGNVGIALFLAYLSKITGNTSYKEAAYKAIESVLQNIPKVNMKEEQSVGAFRGFGGVFYVFHKLTELFSNKRLEEFLMNNSDSMIRLMQLDSVYDIVCGSTGLLAAFLSLSKSSNAIIRELGKRLAIQAGDFLVGEALVENEMAVWPSVKDVRYCGFSHGNSATDAYLYQLFEMTGEERFKEIAQKGMEYIRSCYDPRKENWASADSMKVYSKGWCHGAPGVLLGNAMLMKSGYHDDKLLSEINIGIKTTKNHCFGFNPTYCHGDLGNLAILNYVADVRTDTKLKNENLFTYQELYEKVLSKEWKKKDMKCCRTLGLMIGISGFGYSMIKNYEPSLVPEFLWLQ